MYRESDGKKVGVLVDFDYAVSDITKEDSSHPTVHTHRTLTVPFRPIRYSHSSPVTKPYRYQDDLESFLWVLIWVACKYEDGKLVDPKKNQFKHLFTAWEASSDDPAAIGVKSGMLDVFRSWGDDPLMTLGPDQGHIYTILKWRRDYYEHKDFNAPGEAFDPLEFTHDNVAGLIGQMIKAWDDWSHQPALDDSPSAPRTQRR